MRWAILGWIPVCAAAVAFVLLFVRVRSADAWWWRCSLLGWVAVGLCGAGTIAVATSGWAAVVWAGAALAVAAGAWHAGMHAGGAVNAELNTPPPQPEPLPGEDFLP